MNEMIPQLKKLGFTEYEAKSYIALVQLGQTNAYQVSKHSSIPRARIYDTLNNLVARGIVVTEDMDGAIFYTAMPIAQFIQQTTTSFTETITQVGDYLKRIENNGTRSDHRVTMMKNRATILQTCTQLIHDATERIVLSCWDTCYDALLPALTARAHDISIRGIVMNVEQPLAGIDVHRKTTYMSNPQTKRSFVLAIDGRAMIYGPDFLEADAAYYTNDATHIHLLEDYIWHDVLVNRLVRRSGEDLDALISTERRAFFNE